MGGLENNPSIEWVHPKSTHACPLAWGNNNGGKCIIILMCSSPWVQNGYTKGQWVHYKEDWLP